MNLWALSKSFEEQEVKSIEDLKEEKEILEGKIALLNKQLEKEKGETANRDLPMRPPPQKMIFATPNRCATAFSPIDLEAETREMLDSPNNLSRERPI